MVWKTRIINYILGGRIKDYCYYIGFKFRCCFLNSSNRQIVQYKVLVCLFCIWRAAEGKLRRSPFPVQWAIWCAERRQRLILYACPLLQCRDKTLYQSGYRDGIHRKQPEPEPLCLCGRKSYQLFGSVWAVPRGQDWYNRLT